MTILLKTVRSVNSPGHNMRRDDVFKWNREAFQLLDQTTIGQDEFLLKTVIDACIRGGDKKRLNTILAGNEIRYACIRGGDKEQHARRWDKEQHVKTSWSVHLHHARV